MKTLSLLCLLLLASGACDDVKYISKRNSGRMKSLGVCCVVAYSALLETSLSLLNIFRLFIFGAYCCFVFLALFHCHPLSLPALYSLLAIMLPLVFSHYTPPHSYSLFCWQIQGVSQYSPAICSALVLYDVLTSLKLMQRTLVPAVFSPLIHNHHLCLSQITLLSKLYLKAQNGCLSISIPFSAEGVCNDQPV